MSRASWLLFGLLACPASSWALGLNEAVERALKQSPVLSEQAAKREAAVAAHETATANYGPKLITEANAILWHEEQKLSLGLGGEVPALPPPATVYEGVLAGLLDSLSSMGDMVVREQLTTSLKVQVAQPLVALWTVHQADQLTAMGVDVADLETQVAKRSLAVTVMEAYLRVLQAEAMQRAAEESLANLKSQLEKVRAFETAGLTGRNDTLKVEVAVAATQQQVTEATNNVAKAKAGLSAAMGDDPAGTDFGAADPAEDVPTWLSGTGPSREEAAKQALASRVELSVVQGRLGQANKAVDLAFGDRLPSVNLVGQYEHTTGSSLQADDSLFAGVMFKWTAFEWGLTESKMDEARAKVRQVEAAHEQLRRNIRFEVDSAFLTFDTARQNVTVAQAAVAQAEEARRLEQARFDVQKSTTSDVLDAETALSKAKINLEAARFNQMIALARLKHASGAPLLPNELTAP